MKKKNLNRKLAEIKPAIALRKKRIWLIAFGIGLLLALGTLENGLTG